MSLKLINCTMNNGNGITLTSIIGTSFKKAMTSWISSAAIWCKPLSDSVLTNVTFGLERSISTSPLSGIKVKFLASNRKSGKGAVKTCLVRKRERKSDKEHIFLMKSPGLTTTAKCGAQHFFHHSLVWSPIKLSPRKANWPELNHPW